MGKFTIFTMVYDDCYELLRQFIESIYHNVDPNSYSRIMIIDDYSKLNTKMREYEEWLKEDEKFQIINFPEHRSMAHYTKLDNPNMGHGQTFNLAIDNINTEYLLYLDVDCLFLKKSYNMLNKLFEKFDSNENIIAAGQLFGTIKECIISKRFKFFHGPAGRDSTAGGFLGPSSGACRISAWKENKANRFSGGRLPNLFSSYSDSIFNNNGTIYSYPWFTNMEILHLGRGNVRNHSESLRGLSDTHWYVFCKDFHRRHGPRFGDRDLRSNHYGRGFINMTSNEYSRYLKEKYNKPFDKIQPALNEDLIYTVD